MTDCQQNLCCSLICLMSALSQEFPDKQELHRNMLGLLGNVAEVKALRPQLLTKQFITVFRCEALLCVSLAQCLLCVCLTPWLCSQ